MISEIKSFIDWLQHRKKCAECRRISILEKFQCLLSSKDVSEKKSILKGSSYEPVDTVVLKEQKCFCGRTDIASQIALDYPICTYHNIVYVYNPKKFEEIVKLYKALTCTCFKYAQSFDSEGRCQTCGRINQEVKKELDDFNGKT